MESRPWHLHYDYDVPTTIRYPRVPARNLMQVSVRAYPDNPALKVAKRTRI